MIMSSMYIRNKTNFYLLVSGCATRTLGSQAGRRQKQGDAPRKTLSSYRIESVLRSKCMENNTRVKVENFITKNSILKKKILKNSIPKKILKNTILKNQNLKNSTLNYILISIHGQSCVLGVRPVVGGHDGVDGLALARAGPAPLRRPDHCLRQIVVITEIVDTDNIHNMMPCFSPVVCCSQTRSTSMTLPGLHVWLQDPRPGPGRPAPPRAQRAAATAGTTEDVAETIGQVAANGDHAHPRTRHMLVRPAVPGTVQVAGQAARAARDTVHLVSGTEKLSGGKTFGSTLLPGSTSRTAPLPIAVLGSARCSSTSFTPVRPTFPQPPPPGVEFPEWNTTRSSHPRCDTVSRHHKTAVSVFASLDCANIPLSQLQSLLCNKKSPLPTVKVQQKTFTSECHQPSTFLTCSAMIIMLSIYM